jgi:hypothetical protein
LIYLRGLGFSTAPSAAAPNDPAGQKPGTPPPIPPSGPWGSPK